MAASMNNMNTWAGTMGGTSLVLFIKINFADLFNTAIIAAVGAATSFVISSILRFLIQYLKKQLRKGQ